ncbi:hypothetical protein CPT_Muldoon_185 [Serratia phage Muldoon]|uniref:Uncharacterized protein n=1 Tax=Serratia phage Muldoon TaxID=2601678 RepID=A0A5P8PHF7_9CAUD|nr:hypothetical protein HYP94_gp205 [Serratia phage Muldoon]QFR56136.1 hypothetical protein CPT_Muldoon_185 [Serratia phage Muldoon]
MKNQNSVRVFTPNTYVLCMEFFYGDDDFQHNHRCTFDPKKYSLDMLREFVTDAKEVTDEQPEELPEWFTKKWDHLVQLLKSCEVWWTLAYVDVWYVDEVGAPWSLEKL